jgi:multidrug efflux pump subunit AcrB
LKQGDDQIPIRVRMAGANRMAPSELMTQIVHTMDPGTRAPRAIPIGNLVRWEANAGPTVIARENRERALRIGGNLTRGAALGDVVSDLEAKLAAQPLPDGYRVAISGQNEQMNELFSNVIWALILGALFVYMILASLFESFLQPLTVMAAIPLASIGAVFALLLFGMPLDLYAGIGMILLSGIVAKNSILLVDFAMQKIGDHGGNPADAILETAPLRLRPIIMTSVAMIAGMVPVATGLGSGGAARMGLGIATIGGVISSTILTLFVVPSLFISIENLAAWFRRRRR